MTLSANNVTVGYGGAPIATDLTTTLPEGKITSIIGPNGCGKSTLLRALCRLLPPEAGQVLLGGKAIDEYPRKELARLLGLLPQTPTAPDGITVAELVGRGRSPHQGLFGSWSSADISAVDQALADTGLTDFAERNVHELSGGQRQRVWIAMALAQSTDYLLLDEPTTYLDVAHQLDILDLLHAMNRKKNTTIAMVLHDMNLAARYSDHIIAMRAGRILAEGPASVVMTESTMAEIFGITCTVLTDPVTGAPMVLPYGRVEVTDV